MPRKSPSPQSETDGTPQQNTAEETCQPSPPAPPPKQTRSRRQPPSQPRHPPSGARTLSASRTSRRAGAAENRAPPQPTAAPPTETDRYPCVPVSFAVSQPHVLSETADSPTYNKPRG